MWPRAASSAELFWSGPGGNLSAALPRLHEVAYRMRARGVQATAKHFPGIGRIRNNTDHYAAGITDTTTTADDAALQPFAAAIEAGAGLVMVGTANYARIDPGVPAALSKPIVTGLLRERLGFTGVVVTDDLDARAVAALPAADKAVRAIEAGGDIVLTSLVATGPVLAQALVDKARTDPGFAAAVRASAVRVVALKAGLGLVPGCRG